MPGRFYLSQSLRSVADDLAATSALVDPGERLDAAPGEQVAVLVAERDRALRDMRWSMLMSGRVNVRGRPVMETIVNARSETVFDKSAFQGVRRGILPVNGWYEWTGKTRRKIRWAISDPDQPLLLCAAIWDVWRGPGGIELAQMATLTCEPNGDVRDIHHRMPVLLRPEHVEVWLTGEEASAAPLMRPWPDGRLRAEVSALA